nr:hypothetical protein [Tanacetum cinerariifolium]
MRDTNPIRTLRDYSRPSYEGYKNAIKLPEGNNVVPLRSNTIWLVQNGCSFYGLRSEDPNQHLKDFLKLERLSLKHGIVLRTYSKKSLIMASIFGFKSKYFMTMLIPPQDKPLTNRPMNDLRDFAKLVKAISSPQDVPSKSNCYLIELENQVQCLMKAHLAPKKSIEVNKITSSCKICSGPHDTQCCMENPEQDFVEYASLRMDKVGDASLSKFEAYFKQQQSEMTNKIDTVFTDRMAGELPSDTIKNLKLNVNSTYLLFSSHSYPTVDPKCTSHPYNLINAVKKCSSEINHSQKDQPQLVTKIRTQRPKEPVQTFENEFKDWHINLPILDILAHALMYNAILDIHVESLELGKNGFAFIQGEIPKKIEDLGLFTLPCRLGNFKPFDTLVDLRACVNIIPLNLFKKLNIRLLEETNHVFGLADGTKSYPIGIFKDVEVHTGKLKLLSDFYVIDMKKDLETPLLIGRGFLATANVVIDYRKAKNAVGERIT